MSETIIVGGGVVGVATGLELLRRGEAVRLVEAADGAGMGTSFANGGLLTPSMADPWNAPGVHRHLLSFLIRSDSALKIRFGALPSLLTWGPRFLWHSAPRRHAATTRANLSLAAYSLAVMDEIEREADLAFDSARNGALKIFRSAEALETAASLTRMLQAHGLAAERVSPDRAVAIEPCLAPIADRLAGAIHYPGDGTGDAHLFARAAASMFRQLGGVTDYGRTVDAIEIADGRATGVRIGGESLPASRVIIATGVDSVGLAARHGLKLRIKPVKGYSVTYTPPAPAGFPAMPVIDDALHAAVTPLGARLRVAGTAEFAGTDLRLDPGRVDNLARLIGAIYPDMMDAQTLATGTAWAGLRPVTADGRPYIGRGDCPNLWINAGHGHLGWTMAAGSARLLADLILGTPPAIDPTPFRLGR